MGDALQSNNALKGMAGLSNIKRRATLNVDTKNHARMCLYDKMSRRNSICEDLKEANDEDSLEEEEEFAVSSTSSIQNEATI